LIVSSGTPSNAPDNILDPVVMSFQVLEAFSRIGVPRPHGEIIGGAGDRHSIGIPIYIPNPVLMSLQNVETLKMSALRRVEIFVQTG
jgi:hypothetical protein